MSSQSGQVAARAVGTQVASPLSMPRLRLGLVVAQALLLAVEYTEAGRAIPSLLVASWPALAVAVLMLGQLSLRARSAADTARFARQIQIDIALLSVMLALSGGPGNPFHDTLFLPVAVAAACLPAAPTWRVVAFSLVCYAASQFFYLELPGRPEEVIEALVPGELITHMMLNPLAAYFVLRITRELRQNERQLSEARECAARADCAVAVGSVAAGAAHELGTPLMTISVVLEEMREQCADRPELLRAIAILEGSAAECRRTLDTLRQSAQSTNTEPERLGVMVDRILARFRLMCPTCTVRLQIDHDQPQPVIVPDLALQQSVINLLSNAAAVSAQAIILDVEWTCQELTLRVTDRGPGVPPELADQLGRDFVTTKPGGLGVGLFLTRVTAQRLGGKFNIGNADGGGAVAQVVVPLASLRPRSA